MVETLNGLQGIPGFSKENPIVIGKQGIEAILPHRERMLLLDRVTIDNETVAGEFRVTEEVCKGHAVAPGGKIIMRGCDLYEVAAQSLGVWAAQNPQVIQHRAVQLGGCFVREYGTAKFKEVILPGFQVCMEAKVENLVVKISDRMVVITGKNFVATVNDIVMAEISFVKLVASISTIFDKPEENGT